MVDGLGPQNFKQSSSSTTEKHSVWTVLNFIDMHDRNTWRIVDNTYNEDT